MRRRLASPAATAPFGCPSRNQSVGQHQTQGNELDRHINFRISKGVEMTQTSSTKTGRISSLDILTLIAISICVYTFSDISHEGLGHGLAYVLLGGKGFNISWTACSCAADGFS